MLVSFHLGHFISAYLVFIYHKHCHFIQVTKYIRMLEYFNTWSKQTIMWSGNIQHISKFYSNSSPRGTLGILLYSTLPCSSISSPWFFLHSKYKTVYAWNVNMVIEQIKPIRKKSKIAWVNAGCLTIIIFDKKWKKTYDRRFNRRFRRNPCNFMPLTSLPALPNASIPEHSSSTETTMDRIQTTEKYRYMLTTRIKSAHSISFDTILFPEVTMIRTITKKKLM